MPASSLGFLPARHTVTTSKFDVRLLAQAHETRSSQLLRGLLTHDVLRGLRALTPIVKLPALPLLRAPSFTFVFRFDDVIEVLEHDRVFEVSGERIKRSNGGLNFLLGMPDDQPLLSRAGGPRCPMHTRIDPSDRGYHNYQAQVQSLFRWDDLPRIRELVERYAERVLSSASFGEVDVIEQVISAGLIHVCREYYGMQIPDVKAFKHWLFMLSCWLFDPLEPSLFEASALEASARLQASIDSSIAAGPPEHSVLGRMLARKDLDRSRLRAILSGMILGFVPTTTMAGDHILGQLLEHEIMQNCARRAAESGDRESLKRCLFEAFRFDPLDHEPLRVCTQDYTLGAGKWYRHKLRAGDHVIASTRSAMMDPAAFVEPHAFDPQRPQYNSLLFGYGLHRCIGAPLAETLLTSLFNVLLAHRTMRRVPGYSRQTLGPFATNLKLCIQPCDSNRVHRRKP